MTITCCRYLLVRATLLLLVQNWCVSVRSSEIIIAGPNVCTRLTLDTKDISANVTEPIDKKDNTTVYKDLKIHHECCKNYMLSQVNSSVYNCVPICDPPCEYGTCVAPNTCLGIVDDYNTLRNQLINTNQHYTICPFGMYGKSCANICTCNPRESCNPIDGQCTCLPGWYGEYCSLPCPFGWMGIQCLTPSPFIKKEKQKTIIECPCKNGGVCTEDGPRHCICQPGFMGIICGQECPLGYYGNNCMELCSCRNGGTCDYRNGKCSCPEGYMGKNCGKKCVRGRWGLNCQEFCKCSNSTHCNHITGQCKCPPGYYGQNCELICPEGKYGINCSKTCICHKNKTCNHINGLCAYCKKGWKGNDCDEPIYYEKTCNKTCKCIKENTISCNSCEGICECAPGWMGETCSEPCTENYFGEKCKYKCNCLNGAKCLPTNGTCICTPGFSGVFCNENCTRGTYGENCSSKCQCNGFGCSSTGECNCEAGFWGDNCKSTCNQGFYGKGCKMKCDCFGNGTKYCDSVTGECTCKYGWNGIYCQSKCSDGTYGNNCSKRCNCFKDGPCSQDSGICTCLRGMSGPNCNLPCQPGTYGLGCKEICDKPINPYGNYICDHITGELNCNPGYYGVECKYICPNNMYDGRCQNNCKCKFGYCNMLTGQCHCNFGWTGDDCSIACPNNMYGFNCSSQCKCKNGGYCQSNDGTCKCQPGFMGPTCSDTCPEQYYGEGCSRLCVCDENFVCHPVYGCVCKQGYTGEDCDMPTGTDDANLLSLENKMSGDSDEYSGTKNSSLTAVVGIFIISLLILLIMLTVYYRKRVTSLETVIARVRYEISPLVLNSDLRTSNIFTARKSIATSDVYQICDE